MGDAAASYIRMVQHLIEKCLIFHLTQEECVEALSKLANIKPVITSTVWMEMEKENKEFFEAYARDVEGRAFQVGTAQKMVRMLADAAASTDSVACASNSMAD